MSVRPRISPLLVKWFTWYSRRFIKRHFHTLRIYSSLRAEALDGRPVVLYTNHASWWDPLVGLVVINSQFPDRALYAPIDAAMLVKYTMFSKMGFFGIEKDTRKGAMDFLSIASDVLRLNTSILAVTAQGRFADVRERPANIKRGLGHLSVRVPEAVFIPACIEYVHWQEKLPEVLVRFGMPVELSSDKRDMQSNLAALESALEKTQDELAHHSIKREREQFKTLISGRSGLGGVYDQWRAFKARMRGDEFEKEIGTI